MKRFSFFFFNDTATTEIYTLSLHDALPICPAMVRAGRVRESTDLLQISRVGRDALFQEAWCWLWKQRDRKSTRLNSSHGYISYAVFCLKKKKTTAVSLPSPCTGHSPATPPQTHYCARLPN